MYALAGPGVSDLLRPDRQILTELITSQEELLTELRQAAGRQATDDGATRADQVPAGREWPGPDA